MRPSWSTGLKMPAGTQVFVMTDRRLGQRRNVPNRFHLIPGEDNRDCKGKVLEEKVSKKESAAAKVNRPNFSEGGAAHGQKQNRNEQQQCEPWRKQPLLQQVEQDRANIKREISRKTSEERKRKAVTMTDASTTSA